MNKGHAFALKTAIKSGQVLGCYSLCNISITCKVGFTACKTQTGAIIWHVLTEIFFLSNIFFMVQN